MTEWKTYKLGDVVNILDNRRIPLSAREREQRRGEYPYYGAQGIIDYVDDYLFDGTYLLIAEDGENLRSKKQNIAQLVSGKYWVNNHAHILESNGLCDIRYICYLLNIIDISGYITGSAQPKLNQANLLAISISLPPLEEQRRIAGILGAIDDKIENNRRINTNLELQAQALFDEWCESCSKTITIKELADNILDYTPNANSKVVLLNSSDVTQGLFAELPLVDNVNLKGQFKKRFQKDDILYSEIRPRNKHYAYCYFDSDRYIASTRLIVLRGKKEKIVSNTLLYQYLISQTVFEEFTLKTETRSGTFPQGNYQDLSSIVVPYSDNQKEIAGSLDVIYEEIWSNYKENETLATLRDTLLPKLMNGEIKTE